MVSHKSTVRAVCLIFKYETFNINLFFSIYVFRIHVTFPFPNIDLLSDLENLTSVVNSSLEVACCR